MSFKRVDTIYARVSRNIRSAQKNFSSDEILDAINETYEEISRDGFALRDISDLTTEAGVARYDIDGLYKIQGLKRPADWLEEIGIEENLNAWLDLVVIPSTSSQPVKVLSWAKYLEFYPAPLVSGLTVSVYHYRIPTTALVLGADPETPAEWDYVLTEGATAKLLGGDSLMLYQSAFDRAKQRALTESSGGIITVEHWSDRGF